MKSLAFLRFGAALLTAPALLSAALAQSAAPSAAAPSAATLAAVSPLATAGTIQVHETLLRVGNDGKMPPAYGVDVRIQRPDRVKVVISYLKSARVDQYVQDGGTEYQFDGASKKYQTSPLPDVKKSSMPVRGITLINWLFLGGQIPPASKEPNSRRVVSTVTVNGRAMTLVTETYPSNVPGDPTSKTTAQIWTDAQTRLPYRFLVAVTQKGATKSIQDVIFSDWLLDKPISAAQLAWVPPLGAELLQAGSDNLLAAGTPAPDFAALTPEGKTVHLSDYKGKIVVLDFWATWCGPCQMSMPHLESVYKQVKGQNVAVLGLCVWDQKAAYKSWVAAKSKSFTFPTAFDPAGHGAVNIAGSLYKVTGIPTQYVIDKDGKVAAAYSGYEQGSPQLEKALAAQGVTFPADTKAAKP